MRAAPTQGQGPLKSCQRPKTRPPIPTPMRMSRRCFKAPARSLEFCGELEPEARVMAGISSSFEAGKGRVEGLGKFIAAHVIPRPSASVMSLLPKV